MLMWTEPWKCANDIPPTFSILDHSESLCGASASRVISPGPAGSTV